MAKFTDYESARNESIDNEIDEASERTVEREAQSSVPERFRDKSREEIAQSFVELEQLTSRHANELGDLRRTVANLTEAQKKVPEPAPAAAPVTIDELYTDPDAAVRRIVKEASDPRIDELERQLQQERQNSFVARGRAQFETKHADYKEVIEDPEFKKWITGSQVRLRMAGDADRGDYDMADELFSTYKELKKGKKAPARTEEARAVALERSGGASAAPDETYSRVALTEKRIAAQRGDPAAVRWLRANDASISAAYAEGRLTS